MKQTYSPKCDKPKRVKCKPKNEKYCVEYKHNDLPF